MGRVRADTLGELDGRQVKLADHSQGHLDSPFLTSFICQNCKEQNSRTQQSRPSVCHTKLLSSLDRGSRGSLWSGFCLPGGGGEAELSGCLTTPHNPPPRIQSSPASSETHRSLLLTCRGQEGGPYLQPSVGSFPSICGSPSCGALAPFIVLK